MNLSFEDLIAVPDVGQPVDDNLRDEIGFHGGVSSCDSNLARRAVDELAKWRLKC